MEESETIPPMSTSPEQPKPPNTAETMPLNGGMATEPAASGTGHVTGSSTTIQDLRNIPERYRNPTTIGAGGIGVVTSCLDPNLGRRVALKTLRRKYAENPSLRQRFVREARVMSQLEHPNIVPVHELGERPDGTVYFTMKQVYGESLEWVLQQLADGDPQYLADYPLSRLLDIFGHICQALAFAHSRGAIHRDLKPDNVMIGAFGEVQIMDWGLVKVVGGGERIAATDGEAELNPGNTLEGQVAGTPLYMAPEQARGEIDRLDQRSDVYSLGAILYRILTRRSYLAGKDVKTILALVQTQNPVPPHRLKVGRNRVPRELSAICLKALAKRQEDRYQSVTDMLADLDRYQRGLAVSVYRPSSAIRFLMLCRRHPILSMSATTAVALFLVLLAAGSFFRYQRYADMLASARIYKAEGDAAFDQAVALLGQWQAVHSGQRFKDPVPAEMELGGRQAAMHKRGQSNYDISRLLYAQTAELTKAPVLDLLRFLRPRHPDGRRHLVSEQRLLPVCQDIVDSYRRQIDCTLLAGDYGETQRLFELMDPWVRFTPGGYDLSFHLWRATIQRRLAGFGTLEISANRPAAALRLYHLRGDLAVPDFARPDQHGGMDLSVGALQPGSYLLLVDAPGFPGVCAPFHIGHAEERKLHLHIPERIPEGTAYVPAGPAILGGGQSPIYRRKEIELPGFFIKQFEVTFAEYLDFWRQETDAGRREALMAYVQFEDGAVSPAPAWAENGELLPPLEPGFPVVGIGKSAADAFCAWRSQREGREVRLPTADEWEKAARGADGRIYPWGNSFRWDYAHLEQTPGGEPNRLYAKPGSYPVDRSVYGVFDLGGNVREWTSTPFPGSARRYQIKGGSLALGQRYAASAHADSGPAIPTDVGFRYVMPLQPGE